MAKINSKALDPQRYACIQAEQRELEQQRGPRRDIPEVPAMRRGGFLPACCIPHRITANNRSVPNN